MCTYRWKISFELSNAKLKDMTKYKGKDISLKMIGKNRIKGELFFETNDVKDVANVATTKLDEFLNITVLYKVIFYAIEPTFNLERFDFDLDNRDELLKKGIKIPTKFTLYEKTNVTLSEDSLNKVPERLGKLESSQYKHVVNSLLKQYRIAHMQENPFHRYEQLWIGFSNLLNSIKMDPEWDDKKSINDFACGNSRILNKSEIEEIMDFITKPSKDYQKLSVFCATYMHRGKYASILDFLIKLDIPKWKPAPEENKSFSRDLEEIMKNPKASIYERFSKILFCLYGIRNQLFHATDYSVSELNSDKMKIASCLLSLIFWKSIRGFVVKNDILK